MAYLQNCVDVHYNDFQIATVFDKSTHTLPWFVLQTDLQSWRRYQLLKVSSFARLRFETYQRWKDNMR